MSTQAGQPSTTRDSAVRALQRRKSELEANLGPLLGKCTDDTQRNQLRTDYAAARDQYEAAVNLQLVSDEASLTALVGQSNDLQDQLDADIAAAADIAGIVGKVAVGVKIGAAILKFLM